MSATRVPGFRIWVAVFINVVLFWLCQLFWNTSSTRRLQSLEHIEQENIEISQNLKQFQFQQDIQSGSLQEQLRLINELTDTVLKLKKNPTKDTKDEGSSSTDKNKPLSSFKVLNEIHKTHDIAVPRDIPAWTASDTAHLGTITGLDMMAQLLKEDYNKEDDLTDASQIDFITIGRAQRMYKSLWNHIYPIYHSLPAGRDRDREKALLEMAEFHAEIDFFLRLERRLFPWLHLQRKTGFSLYESYSGQGYVLCAGNRQFEFVVASIQAIRSKLKSNLPIQVFYINHWDLTEKRREFLREMTHDIEVIDISTILDNGYMKLGGWAIKAFSILASKFEEAILIDSDVFFLRRPDDAFTDPGYQATGALFFYDRSLGHGAKTAPNFIKSVIPFMSSFPSTTRMFRRIGDHEQESGVVVINKKKRFNGLLSVCKMNGKWERDLWTYKKFYGDKETFWFGFEMIQEPYAFVRNYGGVIGELREDNDKSVCGAQLHLDFLGRPFWWNGGVMRNKNEGIKRDLDFGYWMSGGGSQEHRDRIVKAEDLKRDLLFKLDLKSEEELVLDSTSDPIWDFRQSCLAGWSVNPLDERELELAKSFVRLDKVGKEIEQKMSRDISVSQTDYNWESV
ncbi:hypothetical protein BGZ76_011767 [Entomortierella beljakovae]|nr:hypothetical protein BGZ76_011767 [Entomortierella beljakovae]